MKHYRTSVHIDLELLRQNVRIIRGRLRPGVQMMAVLKGDAYGHGAAALYPVLRGCGVEQYAVAIWEEGVELRECGSTEPILILGDVREEALDEVVMHRLTPSVFSLDFARRLDACAAEHGVVSPIHIKIDTGMRRIGFAPTAGSAEVIRQIAGLTHLKITGVFSHFACADEKDSVTAKKQLADFLAFTDLLKAGGIDCGLCHMTNSPAFLLMPEAQLDMVRVGDILYGLPPTDDVDWNAVGLRQILSWDTYVVMTKEVPAGVAVGYGGSFVTERPTVIATLPIGFADGYRWDLSNRGSVRIRGKRAPIIGRICMDQCMVDVTDIPGVCRGDTVILMDEELSAAWMSELLKTNIDEVICAISKRVPRDYNRKTAE